MAGLIGSISIISQGGQKAAGMMGTAATGTTGGGGGADKALKQQKTQEGLARKGLELSKGAPRMMHKVMKGAGISMGVSGILKQSQIFTGIVGSLFQILGAFVDVILAPFIPVFVPALRWLASRLPKVSAWAQAKVGPISDWLLDWGKRFQQDPWGTIFKTVWEGISGAASWIWEMIKKGLVLLKGGLKLIWFDIQTWAMKSLDGIIGINFKEELAGRDEARKKLLQNIMTDAKMVGLNAKEINELLAAEAHQKRAERIHNERAAHLRMVRSTGQTRSGYTGYTAGAPGGGISYPEAMKMFEAGHLGPDELKLIKQSTGWKGYSQTGSQNWFKGDFTGESNMIWDEGIYQSSIGKDFSGSTLQSAADAMLQNMAKDRGIADVKGNIY